MIKTSEVIYISIVVIVFTVVAMYFLKDVPLDW